MTSQSVQLWLLLFFLINFMEHHGKAAFELGYTCQVTDYGGVFPQNVWNVTVILQQAAYYAPTLVWGK
jgi:hypothetical protein